VRTLKDSARKKLRRERDKRIRMPWISDPSFRYESRQYPSAHLLGLPTEIRVDILEKCLTERDVANSTLQATALRIGRTVGELSCICPAIRINMVYIRQLWEQTYLQTTRPDIANTISEFEVAQWAAASLNPWWTSAKRKKGKEVKVVVKAKGGKKKRWRPRKCWYCEERHPKNDSVCPMERRDSAAWKASTKRIRSKGAEKACEIFEGKKVVFEE